MIFIPTHTISLILSTIGIIIVENILFVGIFVVLIRYSHMKNSVGSRIKELRTKLGLTQSALADKVAMTYVQIGRYEKRGAVPSSDALAKIADALNTTTDYLMHGDANEAAKEKIKDKELLSLFKSIEVLTPKDKETVKFLLDCIVTKRHVQELAH